MCNAFVCVMVALSRSPTKLPAAVTLFCFLNALGFLFYRQQQWWGEDTKGATSNLTPRPSRLEDKGCRDDRLMQTANSLAAVLYSLRKIPHMAGVRDWTRGLFLFPLLYRKDVETSWTREHASCSLVRINFPRFWRTFLLESRNHHQKWHFIFIVILRCLLFMRHTKGSRYKFFYSACLARYSTNSVTKFAPVDLIAARKPHNAWPLRQNCGRFLDQFWPPDPLAWNKFCTPKSSVQIQRAFPKIVRTRTDSSQPVLDIIPKIVIFKIVRRSFILVHDSSILALSWKSLALQQNFYLWFALSIFGLVDESRSSSRFHCLRSYLGSCSLIVNGHSQWLFLCLCYLAEMFTA